MTQLTPEQEAQIPFYAQKWRDIAYSTDPIDRAKVTEVINRAYTLIDKTPPPIVFCGSPWDYIQKVSVFVKNPQPLDYPNLTNTLNHVFGSMFQGIGELYKQVADLADLAEESQELNPKLQALVDETLSQSFPDVFNPTVCEPDEEQEQAERNAALQQFRQELKQSCPEFELPKELGEGLNTQLHCGNDLFFRIPNQITHELGRCIRRLLGNEREFIPRGLNHLIDQAISSFRQNLPPRLVYNLISGASLATNYNWMDFSISVLDCECDRERWEASVDILQHCGDVYPFENLCYVCDRPTKILFDENELVHALGEPAIEYPDGFQIFAYHGILMPERYAAVPLSQWQAQWYPEEPESRLRQALIEVLPANQLQVDWLLGEENVLLRQLLTEKIGSERILNELEIEDVLNILPQAIQDGAGSSLWVAWAILQNRSQPAIQRVIQRWQTSSGDFSELRRMLLIDALERILNWQQRNIPNYEEDFLPGLTHEEVTDKLKDLPFKLSQELYDLYQWRNGSSYTSEIFLYLYFLPLDQAVENHAWINSDDLTQIRIEDHSPLHLFPAFEFEGEFFAIQGAVVETESSPVFHIGSEGGETLVFNSLTTMMMAIAESYEAGVYTYEPTYSRVHWENMEKSGQIRLKYNLGTAKQLFSEGG